MAYTLIVVDMIRGTTEDNYHQQVFDKKWWERYYATVVNVRILAEQADNVVFLNHINFVEKSHGDVIQELEDLLLLHNVTVVTKMEDDGSSDLMPYLERGDLVHSPLFVCGMNTNACVIETTHGPATKRH